MSAIRIFSAAGMAGPLERFSTGNGNETPVDLGAGTKTTFEVCTIARPLRKRQSICASCSPLNRFFSNHYSLIVTSAHHYTSYWSSHSLAPGSRGRTELNTQCYAKTYPWLSYFSTNLNFSVYIKGLERIQYHKPNDYSRQRSRSNAGTSISSVRLPHQCRRK